MNDLSHFFAHHHFIDTQLPDAYVPEQWGHILTEAYRSPAGWDEADLIIIGCGELRSGNPDALYSDAPDAVREAFYEQFCWHPDVKIYDAGNILEGATPADTRAALRLVLQEVYAEGKQALVMGGSHDLMLEQYAVYQKAQLTAKVVCADMRIDMDEAEVAGPDNFLFELLTGHPNFVKHYSHLGFQSYATSPQKLETLDRLRFDFFRLGWLRESIEEAEPALRAADIFAFDLSCVRFGDAPANRGGSPNGFSGEEACMLSRFAGMADNLGSFGIYEFRAEKDRAGMTAQLLAQMIWYFIDGLSLRRTEADLAQRAQFVEYPVTIAEEPTLFLKSRRTDRWWMQLPNGRFVACTAADYRMAKAEGIPERWLREQERLA